MPSKPVANMSRDMSAAGSGAVAEAGNQESGLRSWSELLQAGSPNASARSAAMDHVRRVRALEIMPGPRWRSVYPDRAADRLSMGWQNKIKHALEGVKLSSRSPAALAGGF